MFNSRVAMSLAPAANPQDAMKQALLSVVQVWLDRLQQQAVVTTFFVTIDSLLFSLTSTTRDTDLGNWSNRDLVINSSLGGAIIFHVCASILAYVATFVLIRYRLHNAEKQEEDANRLPSPGPPSSSGQRTMPEKLRPNAPRASISSTLAASPMEPLAEFSAEVFTDLRALVGVYRVRPLERLLCRGSRLDRSPTMKRDPEASPRSDAVAKLQGIVGVLSRAHTVCSGMSLLGFVLALLGILTYSWTAVPTTLGIFASACMGACGIAATIALW